MKLLSYFARPASAGASLSVLALMALLASSAPLRAQDDPVVARVNGTDVRQSDLAMAEEDLGGNIPQMTPEAKREYLITFVGDMLLVAKAAEAKKTADTNEFKQKLAYARTKLLMESYLQTEAKAAVTDARLSCAEGLLAAGNKGEALAIYKSLVGEGEPKQVKLAATRGMLACAGKKE